MATIKIYGASDDLIEVEGKVPGCDEYNGEVGFIELSLGYVFRIEYTKEGVWEVRTHYGKSFEDIKCTTVPHGRTDVDDPQPCTDTLTIEGPIEWVRFCKVWPMTLAAKRDAVERWVDNTDIRTWKPELIESLYAATSIPGAK